MGVSKVVIIDPNTQTPDVLMDVTGDDTSAGVLLAGNVGTRNDGEKVTGTIPEKTSSDLTVSGATVTAPAGHYASNASATVASGTAGTPTATKGSVSNHSVDVTPSVTNTTGYISGGTQTGTAVSVSASELVSGTKSISANGTGIDVTNYAAVDVDVATEMPGLENALCFSSPSSFTLQVQATDPTVSAAQIWNHMEWTDAATPQSVWSTWDGSTTLTAANGKLYLRGTGNTSITGFDRTSAAEYIKFQFTGTNIECSGNIETLLDYETVAQGNHPTMDDGCYAFLFRYAPITTAPFLPATTLTDSCYYGMFQGCTALTFVPTLSATTLAPYCCRSMFSGCTALTSAPALPATTLATYCYYDMFNGCTALASAPALPATTLATYCYYDMFRGCTSLTSAPALPATTLADYCYDLMFRGCTALVSAPALPATTLTTYCYGSMFYDCTALTSAPVLPATTLATDCYYAMFRGCTALTSAPALPATTLADYCYTYMFYGCTGLKSLPVLPATTLTISCYSNMFNGCTGIKLSTTYDSVSYPYAFRIPESGTGTTTNSSLSSMFSSTGGSFTGTPDINTVYYLSKPLPIDFTIDGDVTASDVLSGKISYANGSRVVGSIASKSSSDLTFAENRTTGTPTVTAPAGYYGEDATKVISMGTITGPTITKGTVSNHTMPLTASIINTGGYFYPATTTTSGTSVSASELVSGTKSISANGTGIDVTNYASVDVAVPATPLQTKSVTPTESAQTVTPDSGYALSEVDVGAISSTYVGSGIARKSSTDLTASGATVTAPAGYYSAAASKAVASGSATAPASISGTSATVSTGTNTLTLSKTVSVTPSVTAGYISSGTAGNSSVSLTASVTTKAAATITPTTSNQTIAAGTYLTGAQTIAGNANLVAGNIKSGVSIFGVTGTFAGDATVYNGVWSSVGTPAKTSKMAYVSEARFQLAATSNTTYMVFAGGGSSSATYSAKVDAYSTDLVHSTTTLTSGRYRMGAAPTANKSYAMFFGGYDTSNAATTSVNYFNTSLTRGTTTLNVARWYPSAAITGVYTVVAGGNTDGSVYSNKVDTYNNSITHGTATDLSVTRAHCAAASVGVYAVFAGGVSNPSSSNNTVDTYNSSLTKSTATNLSTGRNYIAGCSVSSNISDTTESSNTYAIFAGGTSGSNAVDIYNTSLTHSTGTSLTSGRHEGVGVRVNGMAIFGGGSSTKAVDYYTESLTHGTVTNFTNDCRYPAAAAIQGLALFYGPSTGSTTTPATMEVYGVQLSLGLTVPAGYTYAFLGESYQTASNATVISKTSYFPINGAVLKPSTTKSGKI